MYHLVSETVEVKMLEKSVGMISEWGSKPLLGPEDAQV